MKFEEVLPLIRNGRKARMPEWEDSFYIYLDKTNNISIFNNTSFSIANTIGVPLLGREDWELIEEFEEVETWDWMVPQGLSDCRVLYFKVGGLSEEEVKSKFNTTYPALKIHGTNVKVIRPKHGNS